ncbi:ABC transporter substrate-binding protein [Nitratireductor sp. ZSWI3]|uniref:ABC transporter substrate-binding protein n=1 Tax=Nitratireductor sp. ZSWI3 TaxID=2966359 RepID=UPI0021501E05|nr:ABC transporter substrate-binding protein [Nitratireductor sp. ZSWI3]MCR4266643.1 ABC transporter substrate-binding protein [Nitratireductor sp. ZSWI3]
MPKMKQLAAIAVAFCTLPFAGAIADDAPIRIGSFLAVTGQGAFLGDPSRKVLEHFVAETNAAGGVEGRKIELVFYDSRTDAKEAVNFVRRLTTQDKVDLIIGGNTTGETMAVIPFVEQAGIPFISLAGGSVVIDPVKPLVFKTVHTDRISVESILDHARAAGQTKVAALSGPGGFDQSCRTNLVDLVDDYGASIVADEQHGAGDTDMTAQMTNIRAAAPDLMIYCGFGAPSSIVAKNHKQLIASIPLYMTVGAASQDFIDGADGAAEGVYVTGSAVMVADLLKDDDPQAAVSRAFVASYSKAFGSDPSSFAGHAYDALVLAVDAIKRAHGTEPKALRDAIEATDGLPGINGVYHLSATDHMGLGPKSLILTRVENGRFVPTE